MNVNYKSDDNKIKIRWKLLLPEVNMFILQIQTFTLNWATGFLLYIQKFQQCISKCTFQLSRNTSPYVTNTVQNKRSPVCTTENYLKKFIPITVPGYSDFARIVKNCHKVLIVGDRHTKTIRRNDFNKELKNGKAIFQSLVVQTIGSQYPTSTSGW